MYSPIQGFILIKGKYTGCLAAVPINERNIQVATQRMPNSITIARLIKKLRSLTLHYYYFRKNKS